MGAKNMIIGVIFIVAILCIVYFFIIEGFDSTMTAGDAVEAACAKNSTCSTCLATSNCGWASEFSDPVAGLTGVVDGTVLACIPQSGGQPFITSNLANWMLMKTGARPNITKFIRSVGECTDIMCNTKTACSDCAKYTKCIWQQVSAADGTITQSCMDTSSASLADSSHNNIRDTSKCPPPQCSDLTDCQDCTNATGCGFCSSSGKCLKTSEFGPGANQCPTDKKIVIPGFCPCGGITDCAKCAARTGCVYCKGIKKCVNIDKYGMPPVNTCNADDTATSESQCSASTIKHLDMTSSSARPTADSLNNVADSGIIDRASGFNLSATTPSRTDSPVSPSTSYSMVTAPGVARSIGSSSTPATVRNEMNLKDDAPIESYVKMLVNSQLAAQGVPMNEPFQEREADAIPNVTDYLK